MAVDPRVERAIDFHHRRAQRVRMVRAIAFAALVLVFAFVPSGYVRAPVGIVLVLSTLFVVVDLLLVRSHRAVAKEIEADMAKVVWVHYFVNGDKICPLFLYDERGNFAPLHLPGGYARPLIDAFRALEKPPVITTDDDERRIVEPRQKLIAKILEVEDFAKDAKQDSLRALASSAITALERQRRHFSSTLDGTGREAITTKVERLWVCYAASAKSPEKAYFNDEIAELIAKLQVESAGYRDEEEILAAEPQRPQGRGAEP